MPHFLVFLFCELNSVVDLSKAKFIYLFLDVGQRFSFEDFYIKMLECNPIPSSTSLCTGFDTVMFVCCK